MLGTIMAQGKLIASINNTPDQAIAIAEHYCELLIAGIPEYCIEFGCGAPLQEQPR